MAITGDFFSEKREWSKLKDQILDHYLSPYLAKITMNGYPTRIADCFAGKGAFDDGSEGSPLIIARRVGEAKSFPHPHNSDVKAVFIENKYVAELQGNIAQKPGCEVIPGEYETCVKSFLTSPIRDRNYFFYVDPYGVKSLDFHYFSGLRDANFQTLELLINLNTTGFLREGSRLLKLDLQVPDWADDLDYEKDGLNTTDRMNEIAGGDYWQEVLKSYKRDEIDFHEAEEAFIAGYLQRLDQLFAFTISVLIMERSHHMPKYRLVFATNHHSGFILMATEMNKAWQSVLSNEPDGQLTLFDDATLKGTSIQDRIMAEIASPSELRELLICLIRKYGFYHSPADYKRAIKEGEGTLFSVTREPATTKTGRLSTSMDYETSTILVGTGPRISKKSVNMKQPDLL